MPVDSGRSSNSTDKRDVILDGAIAEFLKRGYAAASMDRVATAASVSKATVYNHFQSKDQLFVAIIERLVRSKFAGIFEPEQVAKMVNEPPQLFLRTLATTMLQVPANDPEYLGLMRTVIAESERFPELAQTFLRELPAVALASLTYYFTHCPHLDVPDPEATARIFVGAIAHFIIIQYLLPGAEIIPLDPARLVDTLVTLITTPQP
jgi:AcrR family transcriptional regulator